MELHAPGAVADAEGMHRVVRAAGQPHRALGQAQRALPVHRVGREARRQAAQQRVGGGGLLEHHADRADLRAARMVAGLAAERMREQLVAIADAEHRRALRHGAREPAGGAFAPVLAVRHHRMRTGQHRARDGGGIGQRVAAARIDHGDGQRVAGQAVGDPVLEVAVRLAQGVEGVAELDDDQGTGLDFHPAMMPKPQASTTRSQARRRAGSAGMSREAASVTTTSMSALRA